LSGYFEGGLLFVKILKEQIWSRMPLNPVSARGGLKMIGGSRNDQENQAKDKPRELERTN
jgi:hypothetical protein